jgi:hypothetical protein
MLQHHWKPALLTLTALAITAVAPALVGAQERPDEHRPDQHQAMRADDHRDDHRDDRNHDRADDQVERYRHDHPHSSARCHDGFFTSTKDRNHACSKHGGIDIWLSL